MSHLNLSWIFSIFDQEINRKGCFCPALRDKNTPQLTFAPAWAGAGGVGV